MLLLWQPLQSSFEVPCLPTRGISAAISANMWNPTLAIVFATAPLILAKSTTSVALMNLKHLKPKYLLTVVVQKVH